MHRGIIAVALVTLLGACSTIDKINDTLSKINDGVSKTSELYAEAKLSADANKDGKTDPKEWAVWLAGGGAAAVIAALKSIARNGKSDERKAVMEERIRALEVRGGGA